MQKKYKLTTETWRKYKSSDCEAEHGDGDAWRLWKPIISRIVKLTRNDAKQDDVK